MRASHWIVLPAIAALIVIAFVGGRSMYYGTGSTGSGTYTPPERELTHINLESAAISERNEAIDNPSVSKGEIIVDFAHNNALLVEELNVLFSKIVARGYSYEIVTPDDNSSDNAEEGVSLIDRLPYAETLILPLPRDFYSAEEISEIERFVKKGGRVFIIGDPTRTIDVNALNSIAGSFGIIYANDYLYSMDEASMDNNYRNVVYTNFADSPLTNGLSDDSKVIFYSGSSVSAPGYEIILGDEQTFSSISESGRTMAAGALTTDGQVLALGDLTFFNEPYSAAESNSTLINNVADFLTADNRTFALKDFPYFFNDNITVVFEDPLVFNSQFEDVAALKELLEQQGVTVTFADEIGKQNDIIYIGRFAETDTVQDYLDTAGITIVDQEIEEETEGQQPVDAEENGTEEPDQPETEAEAQTVADAETGTDVDRNFVEGRIQVEGAGELERGGSTLFYLHQEDDRNILVMLSDNPDTNADAFQLLMDQELTACLVDPMIAVCHTETPDGKLPPSLRKTRVDKILVVADDDGRPRDTEQTSMAEYNQVLSNTYKISIWETAKEGSPDLAELQEYDAVIWSTGNYWDDSIGGDDAELLTSYIEAGGNLLLSGASISFDWDHTDFLKNIVHADYLTFAEQLDVEVINEEHPIAKGFAQGDVFTLTVTATEDPLQPDVVNHTADARVIFQRGPTSEKAGAASIIAYEDDRAKVAYYTFPLYLLPSETQALLVNNTVDWFTRKPLDLPAKKDYHPFEGDDSDETVQEEEPAEDESDNGETENGEDENGEENGEQNGEEDENGNNETDNQSN